MNPKGDLSGQEAGSRDTTEEDLGRDFFMGTGDPTIPEVFVRLCETYNQILFSNTGKPKYNILFNLKA